MRYNDANMTLLSPTLALNASAMAVHGLSYRGAELSMEWSAASSSVVCSAGCDHANLCAAAVSAGGIEPHEPPVQLTQRAVARFSAGASVVVSPCQ